MIPSIAMLIAVAVASVSPTQEGEPVCPPVLQTWSVEGTAEPGSEWSALVLETRRNIGVLRELVLRFEEGALSPDEARWFDAPEALEPGGVFTRTWSLTGRELAPLCRLTSPLARKTLPRCFVSEDGTKKVTYSSEFTTDSPVLSTGRVGLSVSGGSAKDTVCEPMEQMEAEHDSEPEESGSVSMDAVSAILDDMARREVPIRTDIVAVPTARRILAVIGERNADLLPDRLPSEFSLTVHTASPPYAEALSLERMLAEDDADAEVALGFLGDRATPASAPLLRVKLIDAVAAGDARPVSLTLRALLAADPQAARLEAIEILPDERFARSALGVFAMTDRNVEELLTTLDTSDRDAVREAIPEVLALLETAAPEEEIREAAHALAGARVR